jgi:hypothetical protein
MLSMVAVARSPVSQPSAEELRRALGQRRASEERLLRLTVEELKCEPFLQVDLSQWAKQVHA